MIDVTDATFVSEVLERSAKVPVVVDLWAPWCGPCKTLGPIIERVVDSMGGSVALAKVNVDENPQVSAAFKVQSIPAVFALKDRQVVDSFVGALPEASVRAFVEKLASPARSELDQLLDAGDEASLRKALELDPESEKAKILLGNLLAQRGDVDDALALVEGLAESAGTRRIAALARLGPAAVSQDGLELRLDDLLEQVKGDQSARQELLDLLEVMGPEDPRSIRYRKLLSARLY